VRRSDTGGMPGTDLKQLCGEGASAGIGDVPIDRIENSVQPTGTQRAVLEKLKSASAQAMDKLKTDCPIGKRLTPPSRLDAMEKRLDAALQAVRIVRPVLRDFYQSLTEEQRAKFNLLGAREQG